MDEKYAVVRLKGVIDFLEVFLQDHRDMGNKDTVKDYEEDIEAMRLAIKVLQNNENIL